MTWYAQPNISSWAAFGTTINSYVNDAYGNVIIMIVFVVLTMISIKRGVATAFATGSVFSMITSVILTIMGWTGANSILITMTLSAISIGILALGGVKDGI